MASSLSNMTETAQTLLTTSQAATLLQVHESSVKRWTNQGELVSQKTAGGHRRIAIQELLHFAQAKNISAAIRTLAPHEEEIAMAGFAAREQNDFSGLQELILKFCDAEPTYWLSQLLLLTETVFDLPLTRIYDSAIGGALREVGRQWQSGSRTIALEHRFTQKVVDALYGKINQIDSQALQLPLHTSPQPPKAIVGCAEGCYHEIGGLMSRILLRTMGYDVTYLGANAPFEEVAGIQELEGAELVCLSFVPPLNNSDVRRSIKVLGALYNANRPYSLIVGGASTEMGWQEPVTGPFLQIKAVNSIASFENWLQTAAANATKPNSIHQ
jgi:MerR family transcriptional regulator, light-induced transcriptional regulator